MNASSLPRYKSNAERSGLNDDRPSSICNYVTLAFGWKNSEVLNNSGEKQEQFLPSQRLADTSTLAYSRNYVRNNKLTIITEKKFHSKLISKNDELYHTRTRCSTLEIN